MEYKPYSYQYETSPRKLQPEYDLPRKNNKAKLNNSKQKNTGKWIKESTYIDGTDEKGENNQIFTIGKERIELVVP